MLIIGRKLNAVWCGEEICDGLDVACKGFEAIDLRAEVGFGTETTPVGVASVCEPEVSRVRMLDYVVDGGEVAAEEGV